MHFKKPFTNHQPFGSDICVLTLLLVRTKNSIILLINWGKISQHWVLCMNGYCIHLSSCAIINWAPFRATWWWVVAHFARWRHQMETFSALLAICAGNSPVPGEFPAQRPVTRNFDVFFDRQPDKRLSKQPWCWWFETPSWSLWRQRSGKLQGGLWWNIGSGHGLALNRLKSHCLNSGAYRRHQTVIC